MIRAAISCGVAALALLACSTPAMAVQQPPASQSQQLQLGTPFPRPPAGEARRRGYGRLLVLLVIQPSCSVVSPGAGEPVHDARIVCTPSVPWQVNLTPADDHAEAFVTLDFVPAGGAWAPLDPAHAGFVPVRFNMDY